MNCKNNENEKNKLQSLIDVICRIIEEIINIIESVSWF